MVDAATWIGLFAGAGLLLGNAYFVTTEFAMTRIRQFDESEFRGHAGLERAWEMTERLEIYLSGCQLGITICSVGLGVVAEPALAALLDPIVSAVGLDGLLGSSGGHAALAALIALAIINVLHVVIGEQAPTYMGIERTKAVARYGAPGLYWWTRLLSPVIRFADWLAKTILGAFGVEITRSWADEEVEGGDHAPTRGELMTEMGSILGNLDLPDERRREVLNALAIDRIEVEDVMVPREEMRVLSTARTTGENLETIRETLHTRYPLVGESADEVVGLVYVPALIEHVSDLESGAREFADVAVEPLTVHPDLPVSDLIDRFQAERQELAVVVGDGRTVGLVTATDAFEEITGELEDPLEEIADG